MSIITVFRKDLEHGLRGEGFTSRKIEQFVRVFNSVDSSQGVMLQLDSTRAMLVNVNGTEQGLCLEDFITAWWVFWVVVYNTIENEKLQSEALGAVRSLFFISACNKSPSQTTQMQMWWRDTADQHGYPTLEAG
ncbi:hypothetical protein [Vibrio atlanticus]|uniref:Uncharacterized protein n=1 Tax=Vibrio atlanticus TaxID=693153 RepID=A0A1C3IVR1_9VIBR|nr:hypothetical protein [Vibrio atlanticus]SBS65524.1 hypothetical protein VAT7223_02751 [Vibrio atlanticus]